MTPITTPQLIKAFSDLGIELPEGWLDQLAEGLLRQLVEPRDQVLVEGAEGLTMEVAQREVDRIEDLVCREAVCWLREHQGEALLHGARKVYAVLRQAQPPKIQRGTLQRGTGVKGHPGDEARCKGCGLAIEWRKNTHNQWMPLNLVRLYVLPAAMARERGVEGRHRVVVTEQGQVVSGPQVTEPMEGAVVGQESHYTTCSAADQFKRRNRKRKG